MKRQISALLIEGPWFKPKRGAKEAKNPVYMDRAFC